MKQISATEAFQISIALFKDYFIVQGWKDHIAFTLLTAEHSL